MFWLEKIPWIENMLWNILGDKITLLEQKNVEQEYLHRRKQVC
jgi:hypothetical protein